MKFLVKDANQVFEEIIIKQACSEIACKHFKHKTSS